MNILETVELSMSYDGKWYALKDFTFNMQKGQICAVVGESGSGKTTLLRLIAGLEHPNRGSIKINGLTVTNDTTILPPQNRNVGLVFQNFSLFPHLTVGQNIAFGLKNDKQKTIKQMLQLIKMETYENKYPGELSGGQEQRVAIARSLALRPQLLMLDEPFSNLDTSLKTELRNEIRSIVKELNISMLFITHDIGDALDIADDIAVLKDGILIQHSKAGSFNHEANSLEVKQLLSDIKTNAQQTLNKLNN